jgi:hypothetical protein
MNFKETRQSVMTAQTVAELYELELDLTEHIGTLHKGIMLSDTTMEQSEIKSNLSMANALLGICRERQVEVKDKGGRLNFNFRMAAKAMLSHKTYDEIMNKAQQPRREVKAETKDLRANRFSN